MNALVFSDTLLRLFKSTSFYNIHANWRNFVMLGAALVLLYLAIAKDFEPLLLLPIGFGMLMVNIPGAEEVLKNQQDGIFYFIGLGVDKVIFPALIFLGIGAMTDFGPMIANPKGVLLGAGAQIGIFVTFIGAIMLGFSGGEAATIGMIGGADGPSTIFVAMKMIGSGQSRDILSAVVIAAYSYMALIPIIQPPIIKLLTTKKEKLIRMRQLRTVSKKEKIIFPIAVTLISGLIIPSSLPLIGMLMLGNLLKESMVTERLANVASNALINIVTIFLGVVVGAKALGDKFLEPETFMILGLGLFAFIMGTAGGVITAKIINLFSKDKINPLIGCAGVSAIPIAARIAHKVGKQYDNDNYLLMHAMGANVAGSIGSAVAAGVLLAIFF